MTINQQAVSLTKLFFELTNRKATQPSFVVNVAQAKLLLKSYSYEQIEVSIKHCVENPPRKGFSSLAWLHYDIENILRKLKVQEIKKEMESNHIEYESDDIKTTVHKPKNASERVGKDFDFNIFGE